MSRKTYTHISPRDFKDVSDFRDTLIYNYAVRIHNHSGAKRDTNSLRGLLLDIFGAEWYCVPFNKLVSAAKISNYGSYAKQEFKRENTKVLGGEAKVSVTRELQDSTFARAILKYYNKELLQDILSFKLYGLREGDMYYIRERFVDAISVAKFIEKYDKKSLKMLKSAKSFHSVAWFSHSIRGAKEMAESRSVLPQNIVQEICADEARDVAKQIANDKCEYSDMDAVLNNIRDRIVTNSYRVNNYGARYRNYHIKHLCEYVREYSVAKDYARILGELQLEAVNNGAGWFRKINRKAYNAAKQVAKTNVSLAAKQKTLRDMTDYIYRYARFSRVIWIPALRVKEGEK